MQGIFSRKLSVERYQNYSRLAPESAQPAPNATITVYEAGTLTLADIFADNNVSPTPKANPFTADSSGYFFFYAANGRYDVRLSGGGIVTPFTWGDVLLSEGGIDSYTISALPTPAATSTMSTLARVTDNVRGLWMDVGTRWASIQGEVVNVQEFGATGDGTTDDTAAIQAALAATPSGGTLLFPPGTYHITDTLERHQVSLLSDEASINIVGGGKRTIIRKSTDGDIFFLWADEGANVSGWSMRDILLVMDSGTTTGNAITLRHWHRGYMENVYILGAAIAALKLEQCILNTFANVCCTTGFDVDISSQRPQLGIWIDDYLGVASNANTFIGGEMAQITSSTGAGVLLDGTGRGNRFYNTSFEANKFGIIVGPNHVDWAFDGCWLESNTTSQYQFGNGQGIFKPAGDLAERMVCTYRAKGTMTGAQSTTSGTPATLSFGANAYNVGYSGNIHNVGTQPTRFVAPVPALYHVDVIVSWAANSTGTRTVAITRNGVTNEGEITQTAVASPVATRQCLSVDLILAKDEYVTVVVLQDSGGALDVLQAGTFCCFRWVAEPFLT